MQQLIKWYQLNGWYERAKRLKEKQLGVVVLT